jgi:hypothetical protein
MSQEAQARQRVVLSSEEISEIADTGGKPAETLMKVVAVIATRFQTDLCSVREASHAADCATHAQ